MKYVPGQILSAVVNGKESEVYLTLSELDTDGRPRWRYAPSQGMAQELIPRDAKVDIVAPVDRMTNKRNLAR